MQGKLIWGSGKVSHSACQGIPNPSDTPKVHCRIHNSLPLGQPNPAHTLRPYINSISFHPEGWRSDKVLYSHPGSAQFESRPGTGYHDCGLSQCFSDTPYASRDSNSIIPLPLPSKRFPINLPSFYYSTLPTAPQNIVPQFTTMCPSFPRAFPTKFVPQLLTA
jgi:hypothetical protein